MLTIRLQRIGKAKCPLYRLIISEKARDTAGNCTERLGHYNPRTKEFIYDAERIKHWLSKGAQASNTVMNLLISKGVAEGKKRKKVNITKKRSAKLQDKKKTAAPAASAALERTAIEVSPPFQGGAEGVAAAPLDAGENKG